jgi:VIT1/CCC1 family predicted Fe2+/Mn2+ transporter
MEDGTVSIFGLVLGVSTSAPDAHAVLLAGATGAVAAAVSMMAGTYLDVESENDRRAAAVDERRRVLASDPDAVVRAERARLDTAGFTTGEIETITSILRRHPDTAAALDTAFGLGIAPAKDQRPAVQAAWMFIADLFAAFTPVLPFAWFTLRSARIVSLVATLVLLILLGIGRARLGRKAVVATTLRRSRLRWRGGRRCLRRPPHFMPSAVRWNGTGHSSGSGCAAVRRPRSADARRASYRHECRGRRN